VCQKNNAKDAIFCSGCGTRLRRTAKGAQEFKYRDDTLETSTKSPKAEALNANKKILFSLAGIATSILLVFLIFSANNANVSSPKEPAELYVELKSKFEAVPISQVDCDSVARLLENEPYFISAQDNLDSVREAKKALTETTVDRFVVENPWVLSLYFLQDDLKEYGHFVRELSDPILDKAVAELDKSSQDQFNSNAHDGWYGSYRFHVVEVCQLEDELQTNSDLVSRFDNLAYEILRLAPEKYLDWGSEEASPEENLWYPEGFTQVARFPGFAYKNSDRACSFSIGSCAIFEIVSITDCPTNLYVQTNLLDGGTVVDWSNDTAIVRAGQVALMETTFTSSYGSKWEFVDISCY
jgi:hypothetical protein